MQAHKMRKDKTIIELQEQLRKLTMELDQVKGFVPHKQQGYRHWELDASPTDIAYSSSY